MRPTKPTLLLLAAGEPVARREGKADDHHFGAVGQHGADGIAHLNTEGSHSDSAGM